MGNSCFLVFLLLFLNASQISLLLKLEICSKIAEIRSISTRLSHYLASLSLSTCSCTIVPLLKCVYKSILCVPVYDFVYRRCWWINAYRRCICEHINGFIRQIVTDWPASASPHGLLSFSVGVKENLERPDLCSTKKLNVVCHYLNIKRKIKCEIRTVTKKKIPFNIFVFFLLHVFNWYCLVVGKWKLGRLRCYFCLLSWQINRPGFSFDQRDTGLYISSYSNRVFNCDCDCTWLYVSTDVF